MQSKQIISRLGCEARLTPHTCIVSKIVLRLGYEPSLPQPHICTASSVILQLGYEARLTPRICTVSKIISRLGYEAMSYEPSLPHTTRLQSKQNYLTTGL